MADIVPNTKVVLLSGVPFDATYSDVVDFSSATSQSNALGNAQLFKAKSYTDFTYQRVNNQVQGGRPRLTIRVPELADNLYNYNYLKFQNTAYGDKWFYAFIKQVNYINPECTEIVYELDHYQTWMFDFEIKPCMVLREHTNDDTPFTNILKEPVEVEHYQIETERVDNDIQHCFLFASDNLEDYNGMRDRYFTLLDTKTLCGIPSGLLVYKIDDDFFFGDVPDFAAVFAFFQNQKQGVIQMIASSRATIGELNESLITMNFNLSLGSISGYVPKNNKLRNSQFQYLKAITAKGDTQNFLPEELSNFGLVLHKYKVGNGTPCVVYLPEYGYVDKQIGSNNGNYSYAIIVNDVTQCAWSTDAFHTWLSQNYHGAVANVASSISSMVSAVSLTDTNGSLGISMNSKQFQSGEHNLIGAIANIADKANMPDYGNGNKSYGSTDVAINQPTLTVYKIAADYNSLVRADNFMSMYGYRTEKIKAPNLTGRRNWNYVQLQNPVIVGHLPVDAMAAIKNMFSSGVRIWHSITNVGNFSLNNDIIGGNK